MIKLCVFDLDGTLVDSIQDIANSANYALEKNGFPTRTLEEFPALVSEGLKVLIHRLLGDNDTSENVVRVLEDYAAYYRVHYMDFTRSYIGVLELLDELKKQGVLAAVLSNKADHSLKVIIENMYPESTFSLVVGYTDRFPLKPDPASLLYIMQELKVSPEDTLYIGDSEIDVFTAHNAGAKAVGVSWGFRGSGELKAAGADYIVDSPGDILSLLGR